MRKGVDASKLEAIGYGKERPISQVPGEQEKNRRVEFKIETAVGP